MKHIESRDPKGASANAIEVLIEVELDRQHRPNALVECLTRAGFDVQELTRTVEPRGAVETSDPGSTGRANTVSSIYK